MIKEIKINHAAILLSERQRNIIKWASVLLLVAAFAKIADPVVSDMAMQCQFLPKATVEHISTYLGNRQAEVIDLGNTPTDPGSCFATEGGRITVSTDPNIASGLGGSIWPANLQTDSATLTGQCERIRSLALPSQTICTFPK